MKSKLLLERPSEWTASDFGLFGVFAVEPASSRGKGELSTNVMRGFQRPRAQQDHSIYDFFDP